MIYLYLAYIIGLTRCSLFCLQFGLEQAVGYMIIQIKYFVLAPVFSYQTLNYKFNNKPLCFFFLHCLKRVNLYSWTRDQGIRIFSSETPEF